MRSKTQDILFAYTVKALMAQGLNKDAAEQAAKESIARKAATLDKIKFTH